MNRNKKIEVNASSILGLKAELLRQEEEYKKTKLQREIGVKPTPIKKKGNIWSKQNAGVLERSQRDIEEKVEEEDALLKSRKALEAKTRLYDQMSQKMPSDSVSENYLVDFQRKVINSIKEKRAKACDDDDDDDDESEIPENSDPEEEWVDYVDTLGRSRRCLRKDLPYLTQLDKSLSQRESAPVDNSGTWQDEEEEEDEKLEDEEESKVEGPTAEEMAGPMGPVHYQTVQEHEIRDHGVGYFAFSTDEEERKKQQELLENLRRQTQTQKSNREKQKEKRKALVKERLKKVQQRKNIQTPLPVVDDDESETENTTETGRETVSTPTIDVSESSDPAVTALRKPTTVRPWDKGKIGVRNENFQRPQTKKQMTENEWLDNQRTERMEEFAPPQFYFDSSNKKNSWYSWSANSVPTKSENKQETKLPSSVADIPLPPGEG